MLKPRRPAAVLGVVLLGLLGTARALRSQARSRDELVLAAAQAAAGLEREQAAAAQLREVDQAKDRFLSSVSHELRTPLTSMIGYAEMLAEGEFDPLTDDQQRAALTVLRNGHRLLALVEDLMAYTQLASGQTALTLDAVPVPPLLDTAAAAVAPAAAAKMHTVSVTVAPGTPDVHGDVGHLTRLVENVLDNAVKFSPAGGHITLHAAPHDEDDQVDPGGGGRAGATGAVGRAMVRVTVTDDGPGIPEHEQTQLFSRFHRSAAALRQAVPGTGLGLVHAAAITAAHSGLIALDSAPGVGTTVVVDLPVHCAAPTAGPVPARTTRTAAQASPLPAASERGRS